METKIGEGKLARTVNSEVELQGGRYFTTLSGLLIPEEWRDVCDRIVSHKAPKEWSKAMARAAPADYSEVKAAKESHE